MPKVLSGHCCLCSMRDIRANFCCLYLLFWAALCRMIASGVQTCLCKLNNKYQYFPALVCKFLRMLIRVRGRLCCPRCSSLLCVCVVARCGASRQCPTIIMTSLCVELHNKTMRKAYNIVPTIKSSQLFSWSSCSIFKFNSYSKVYQNGRRIKERPS